MSITLPDMHIASAVEIAKTPVSTQSPPRGCRLVEDLGILAHESVVGQVVHRTAHPDVPLFETRCTITPAGDYLLMFPEGGHYGGKNTKVNDLLAYRSSDRGKTWKGPSVAFDIDYNQHGFIPLIPRGSKRIYAFGTQPVWGMWTTERGLGENAPIGYRYSDDDGYTWSEVRIIRPQNDPDFRGMSVMRMCETDSGAWILGSHEGDWSYKPLMTRQYVLRSADQGKTWTVYPNPRHGGWCVPTHNRMDEGRPINLGGGEIFMLLRTPAGQLWSSRSLDDGITWENPSPTPLVHPDAPPMLTHLSDGKTLLALHHNRFSDLNYTGLDGTKPEVMKDRSEIWVSLSSDGGRNWSEPRFLFVNALAEYFDRPFRNYQCSYIDLFPDGGALHLFVPHRWRQVLHLTLPEAALSRLPARAELA
jgi:hypothetical protein